MPLIASTIHHIMFLIPSNVIVTWSYIPQKTPKKIHFIRLNAHDIVDVIVHNMTDITLYIQPRTSSLFVPSSSRKAFQSFVTVSIKSVILVFMSHNTQSVADIELLNAMIAPVTPAIASHSHHIGPRANQRATANAPTHAESVVIVAQNNVITLSLDCNRPVKEAIKFAIVATTGASLSHIAI